MTVGGTHKTCEVFNLAETSVHTLLRNTGHVGTNQVLHKACLGFGAGSNINCLKEAIEKKYQILDIAQSS